MPNSDKTEKKIICDTDELQANEQQIVNSYIRVYVNHLVKKFRNYNSDEFAISISGLDGLIDKDYMALTYLVEELRQSKFDIAFRGKKDHIDQINVDYTNVTNNKSYDLRYHIQDLVSTAVLSCKTDIPILGIIIMRIVAQIIIKSKTLYKAIVLDLDDTLWPGTLSEIGIDGVRENLSSEQGMPFITFMKFCRTLATELGIFVAICSRNNSDEINHAIENQLSESVFPLKNQIDCLVANNNDKSDNIGRIAKELSILPDSIVFIDDNQIARDEVRSVLPNVFVPDWSNHNELSTQLIAGCLFERADLSLNSQNRRKQYKIIRAERTQNALPELSIKVIDDNHHTESRKLYSKSNQFKISVNDDDFDSNLESLYFEIYRENGENLGICSAMTYTISDGTITLINWAISCRYFQIGVEEFILLHLKKITNRNKVFINYQESVHNLKAKEMLEKYCDVFKRDGKEIIASIEFTEDTVNNLRVNTNLRDVNE